MRYATVVASAYEDSPRLAPLPSSLAGARRIERELTRPGSGWTVESMLADRSWPERLEAALESLPERPESILLSFHGYVAWVGDREPSLLLNGPKPRAIPARRICSLLEVWSDRVLVILDVIPVVDMGKSRSAIADALRSALDGLGVGVLIGARIDLETPPGEDMSFADAIADRLDRMSRSVNGTAVMARDVYREITEHQPSIDPAFRVRYFASAQDFMLVPPRPPGAAVSRPEPDRAVQASAQPPAAAGAFRYPPVLGSHPPSAPQHSSSTPPANHAVDSVSPPVSAGSDGSFDPFAAAAQVYQFLFETVPPPPVENASPVRPSPVVEAAPSPRSDASASAPRMVSSPPVEPASPRAESSSTAAEASRTLPVDDDDDQPLWLGTRVSFEAGFRSRPGATSARDRAAESASPGIESPAIAPPQAAPSAPAAASAPPAAPGDPVATAPIEAAASGPARTGESEPVMLDVLDSGEELAAIPISGRAPPPVPVRSRPPPAVAKEPLKLEPLTIEFESLAPPSSAPGEAPAVEPRASERPTGAAARSGERQDLGAERESQLPPMPELLFNEVVVEGPPAEPPKPADGGRIADQAPMPVPPEPAPTALPDGNREPASPQVNPPIAPSLVMPLAAPAAESQAGDAHLGDRPAGEPSALDARSLSDPFGAEASSNDLGSEPPGPDMPTPQPEAPPTPLPSTPEQIADELAERDELDAALEHYRFLLSGLADSDVLDRARLLVKVGDMERRLGQVDSALARYHQAFGLDPLNLSALFWATEILYDRHDFLKVEDLLQRRLDLLTNPVARVEVLRAMVDLWFDEQRDLGRARHFLDQILREAPEDQQALETLIQVQHGQGDHEEAIRTQWWLASICAEDRSRQARLLVEAARSAHRYLGDASYAVDLGEQALHADPKAYDALELVASLLVETGDWEHLARSYETVLELECDDWVALDLCEKLAVLYRDKLGDPAQGARALEHATRLDPTNARLRLMLADIYLTLQQESEAIAQCRLVIRDQPEQAVGYRAAFDVYIKLGGADGAWRAANAVEYLGAAEAQHTELLEARRDEGLLPVKNVLCDEDWDGSLLWSEHDPALQRLLKLVTEVAIDHRRTALEREKKLLALDPAMLQDPSTSTTMLSRSMLWVARLLGVPVPALYIYPTVPGELGAAPAREPSVLASRSLGSGFSLRELVFLWARHLTSLRGEHHLLLYYPTVGELAQLVTAAFVAGELTPRRADFFDPAVGALAEALFEGIGEEARTELGEVTAELGLSEAGARMLRWARGLEIVAARVGLLASGDVRVAGELTRRFPVGSQTTPDEQRRDLLIYSMSEEYAELRRRLGVDTDGQA